MSRQMSLVDAISLAQDRNAAKLAAEIPPAKPELDSEGLMHLRHYAAWCKQRGVRFCPSKPSTIAAFIRSEAANHVPPATLFAAMLAVEALHDSQNEPNPVACAAPRAELMRIMDAMDKKDITIEGQAQLAKVLDVRPPESWSKSERLLFDDLPPAVKGVIFRRDEQQRRAVRHAQNEAAELRHKLKSYSKKEIENAEIQST
jgi:hypothetical protein